MIEDTNGNYVTYTYKKDKGRVYPHLIDYTWNHDQGPQPAYLVEFKYTPSDEELDVYTDWMENNSAPQGGTWEHVPWDVDLWWARPVVVKRKQGDSCNQDYDFYGAYATYKGIENHGLDMYFFASDDKSSPTSPNLKIGDRHIYTLGIHNNAVHQALFYPKMRRHILMGGLNALADAQSPQDFIATYTPVPIRMVREAGYRLSEWTLPE